MRNIFDQYTQPENRLTHALISSLAQDRRLLRQFIINFLGLRISNVASLEILEQQLPGESYISEDESEERGLPDAWIHDNESWCLLIECKISANLTNQQLERHLNTAIRKGFSKVNLLAIGATGLKINLSEGIAYRKWTDIYLWLTKVSSNSEWAYIAKEYFEVAEAKLANNGYLKEGTLTVFSGIPFGPNEPYNYTEAKRVLNLAMAELRSDTKLRKVLKLDPKGKGRGAITGKQEHGVWDCIRIIESEGEEFAKYPHFTLSIDVEKVLVILTLPNSLVPTYRIRVKSLGYEGFYEVIKEINNNLKKVLAKEPKASPWVSVVQRRYETQRSIATRDAILQFDLRTAIETKGSRVKIQEEWLETSYEAFCNKKSNMQFSIGATFPYRTCKCTQDQKVLEYIANTWIATKPILNVMRGDI